MSREALGKRPEGIWGAATKDSTEPQSTVAVERTSATEPQYSAAEAQSINLEALDQAVSEAIKYPKITIWSTAIAAIMRYNQITINRYSMSKEARAKLKRVLQEEYPELWEEVQKRMPEGLHDQ